ncbi:hypothetical protein KIM67_02830 [Flagellimonas sp. 389]|uniref:hypothetical protein n=1 Tax=Flagellimonas sp. 389 TaxID=2835862 RepID=UPI001BD580F0|nr:hypothetical protein [Flagellimonas sp. 389]MBS9461330.1 hypothetical protein [Flagellimonas sp. 389]
MMDSAQAQITLEKGKVYDSIPVTGSDTETFALYLPESYVPDNLNPIVFIFEPGGRGSVGVSSFIKASEKYGYIIVCSNDSRNGPYTRNFDIANRLFDTVFARFLIKEDEMYVAGMSGGSRLASAIASLTDRFAGVIACGAGFSGTQEHIPSTQNYAYVGLCGYQDMNYGEMLGNTDYLDLMKFNSTLITFSGEHKWPPQSEIIRAFDWLYLQQLKKSGTLPLDTALKYYTSDYGRIAAFIADKEFLLASEEYERLIQTYNGPIAIDSLKAQLKAFKNSKDYKKQKTTLENALALEGRLKDKLGERLLADFKEPDAANFSWWEKELDKLNKLRTKEDAELKKMVYRLKFSLYVRTYSWKNTLMHTPSEKQSEFIDRFIALLYLKK